MISNGYQDSINAFNGELAMAYLVGKSKLLRGAMLKKEDDSV